MSGYIEFSHMRARGMSPEVELRQILEIIDPEGSRFVWTVRALWAIGDITVTGRTMQEFIQESETSATGAMLTWPELVTFADCVFQVIDGSFEAYRNQSEVPAITAPLDAHREELEARAQIIIEALDGTIWSIFTQDDEALARLKTTFGTDSLNGHQQ